MPGASPPVSVRHLQGHALIVVQDSNTNLCLHDALAPIVRGLGRCPASGRRRFGEKREQVTHKAVRMLEEESVAGVGIENQFRERGLPARMKDRNAGTMTSATPSANPTRSASPWLESCAPPTRPFGSTPILAKNAAGSLGIGTDDRSSAGRSDPGGARTSGFQICSFLEPLGSRCVDRRGKRTPFAG